MPSTQTTDPKLWRAMQTHAHTAKLSMEAWLRHQLDHIERRNVLPPDDSTAQQEEAVLDQALRHFQALRLSPEKTRELAATIEQTIEVGEPQTFTTSSGGARRHIFQRRLLAVGVRSDDIHLKMPLTSAWRLVEALRATAEPGRQKPIAA